MRENRPSGLMRGGKQMVIGSRASQPIASRLLYTPIVVREGALRDSWEEYLIPALWQLALMLGVVGWALVWRR